MVLFQAGLLAGGEGVFRACPTSIDGKADLEATALLRALRSMQ
jgi:hypothetical protein